MIDKAKLIKLGLVVIALISMGAFFAWYITSNSYETKLANQTTEYNKQLKANSDKAASDMKTEIEKHNKTQAELNALDITSKIPTNLDIPFIYTINISPTLTSSHK